MQAQFIIVRKELGQLIELLTRSQEAGPTVGPVEMGGISPAEIMEGKF